MIQSDETLVLAARSGDQQAFYELVKRHEKRVAATIIGMLGNCPEADDVGQETFIRFYKSLDSFRGDSKVSTYLTRIAMNLSLNEIKRRKRQAKIFRASADDFSTIAVDNPNPEGFELNKKIQYALSGLDPKFRSVLVLRLIDGYSTEDTARMLKLPIGTVLSRLARAQQKMRSLLSNYLGD